MKTMYRFVIVCLIILSESSCDPATLGAILSTPENNRSLSQEEIVAGLKDALKTGASLAVNKTSIENGFYNDVHIKIPFPPEAERVKTFAISHGLQQQVTAFEQNLNRAAEKAAAKALPVFTDAITKMTIEDAIGILHGDSTAATAYLRKATTSGLTAVFTPIVQNAIDDVQLTSYYSPLAKAYNTAAIFTGEQQVDPDLTAYVTAKALNGLFYYVSKEEKNIRKGPRARITDILKKVFGSVDGKS